MNEYRRGVRAAFRGVWTGALTVDDFIDSMTITIRRGLTKAWAEGMKKCGLTPAEMTPQEETKLEQMIAGEYGHVFGAADYVAQNTKANKVKLAVVFARAAMWVNRYNEVTAIAQTMACGDKKFKWLIGATELHCRSCAGLHARVYRGSVWVANNAHPQGHNLECKGFLCQCRLEPTTDRITPGKFPSSLLAEHDHDHAAHVGTVQMMEA